MNEMFLLKMGEIVLKGLNRSTFEGRLHSNLNRRLKPYGKFKIRLLQSTVYVEPEDGWGLGGLLPGLRRGGHEPQPWL